jgi:hypothetical protein
VKYYGEIPKTSEWTSLEIAKLVASITMPLAVVFVGFLVQRTLAQQDRSWRAHQQLAERRLAVYNDVRKELNRIYCFVEDVGTWKEETPDSIIRLKRIVDEEMHTNRAIWAPDTFAAYLDYMTTAFATYQGIGEDAKINTSAVEKRVGVPNWKPEWETRLTGTVDADHRKKYQTFIELVSRDLTLK